jgi:hypothetical protein
MFGGVKKGFKNLANKLMGSSQSSLRSVATEKGIENSKKTTPKKSKFQGTG